MLERKRGLIPSILAALMPSMALAHGGEVLFLPLGQVVEVAVAVILLWPLPQRGFLVRTISVLCAIGVALAIWFIPGSWFPESLRGPTGLFSVGFVPPLAVVGFIMFVFRGFRRRNKKDA